MAARASVRAYALLTMTALMWGCNAVFARLAVGEVSPMALVSLRWLGALLLLLVFAQQHVRREWSVLRQNLVFLSIMGAFGFSIFNALFYVAAHSTTAVNIGIIQGSVPVFVLIGALLVYRTPVSVAQMAGVLATIAGVTIVASSGDLGRLAALAINHGDILMVTASLLYAGYTVGLRRRPEVGSLALFTVMASAAFLVSLPLVILEMALGAFQPPTATGWLLVGLIAFMPSFLAQVFYIKGVDLIGPGRAGIFFNLIPVFASILAVVLLDEAFEIYHVIALALVLGGIWLAESGKNIS